MTIKNKAIPRAPLLKKLQFYLALIFWYVEIRPIEKRWREIEVKDANNRS